jgi:threonine synthase
MAAYRLVAEHVGVFCEPASAAPIAGILKLKDELPEGPVVCTLTGHGLKDPDRAIAGVGEIEAIPPTLDAVLERIQL